MSQSRIDDLINYYELENHVEGGCFNEVYTSGFKCGERPVGGSIYYMLVADDISRFHRIDCEEIWYFHEGCGLRIIIIEDGALHEEKLGGNFKKGEHYMVTVPEGAVFACENLDKNSYTFVSCHTNPKFRYDGFEMITQNEFKKILPSASPDLMRFCIL